MKNTKKQTALLVSVVLLLTVTVGGTLAYLVAETGALENIFTPAQVKSSVWEESTEVKEDEPKEDITSKSNIQIQNDGTTSAFIRVKIVMTWQDSEGKIGYSANSFPNLDALTLGTNWVKHEDGYYYYKEPVAAGAKTPNALFTTEITSTTSPEGYNLVIDILADAIQAEPNNNTVSAVIEAWGVDPTALSN